MTTSYLRSRSAFKNAVRACLGVSCWIRVNERACELHCPPSRSRSTRRPSPPMRINALLEAGPVRCSKPASTQRPDALERQRRIRRPIECVLLRRLAIYKPLNRVIRQARWRTPRGRRSASGRPYVARKPIQHQPGKQHKEAPSHAVFLLFFGLPAVIISRMLCRVSDNDLEPLPCPFTQQRLYKSHARH